MSSDLRRNLIALLKNHPDYDGKGFRLAQAAGVSQSTVSRLLAGVSTDPTVSSVQAIAEALGVSVEQLLGHEPLIAGGKILDSRTMRRLPVVPIAGVTKRMTRKSSTYLSDEWMTCPVAVSDQAAVIRVENAAMEPTLSIGDYLFCDPKTKPVGNDLVLAFPDEAKAGIIRRLMIDGDRAWLVADNPAWLDRHVELNTLADVTATIVFVGRKP